LAQSETYVIHGFDRTPVQMGVVYHQEVGMDRHSALRRRIAFFVGALILVSMACSLMESKPESSGIEGGEYDATMEQPQQDAAPTVAELAKSTVQVLALASEGGGWTQVWTGSGSVVSPEGLILTNAHVVDDRYGDFEAIGIALTDRSDETPQLSYLAEVAAVDYGLDLAVVRIVSNLEGDDVRVELPSVEVGDSDGIEIGDHLRILGYPGIGGGTISFTEGAVSGFTRARGVDGRAWVKTDATIAGGSSGGMGANERGELVGIPTIVTSGAEDGQTVDCRPLADTNRDGMIDSRDTCVPVGGFINALRPVNLAKPLIDAAHQGEQYVREAPADSSPSEHFDLGEAVFFNIEFSDGVTAQDQPTNLFYALPSGATDVCVFWDYIGMENGVDWSLFWFMDGAPLDEYSSVDERWAGDEEGNWWACVFNSDGFKDGLYEVVFEIEGEVLASESIFIGGVRTLAEFELDNQSDDVFCYVYISPTMAQNWGFDELGGEEVIEPGARRAFTLATGEYDLRIEDCEGIVLLERYEIPISGDTSFRYPE
jgi:S1-C subfamily serine protease